MLSQNLDLTYQQRNATILNKSSERLKKTVFTGMKTVKSQFVINWTSNEILSMATVTVQSSL